MSGNVVGNNSNDMREWAKNIQDRADNFDQEINKLYSLVEGFFNSRDFKGSLSDTFYNMFMSIRPEFMKYSTTFRDSAELINARAGNIDNNRAGLKNQINSRNYYGN